MTQEEIIKKAYEVYPEMEAFNPEDRTYYDENETERDAYIEGLTEQLDCPKIKGWVARDKSGNLNFFLGEPRRLTNTRGEEYWIGHARMKQPNELFPNLRWEDEPIEVELSIKKI